MNNYYDIDAMRNDSSLRVTMEKYSYNLWALISLVGIMLVLRTIDQVYLYNIIVFFLIAMFFGVYSTYTKGK
jgi:hypothetical protein